MDLGEYHIYIHVYVYVYVLIYIYSYIFITSGEKAYATVPRDALAQAGLQGH